MELELSSNVILSKLPTEILLRICENVYIIDDLNCLYKSCKLFKNIIDNYKYQILDKLFLYKSFSNSYYNLFFSFINRRYEYTKDIPHIKLKQLLEWHNHKYLYKIESIELLNFFIDLEKFTQCFVDDCLPIFKNFMYLLYIPSDYIYNSTYLLKKFFNINGLCKKAPIELIKIQKELNYYNIINKRKTIYTVNNYDETIFEILINLYLQLIVTHLLNFKEFVNDKKYKQILHNFIINLFLEWLFENECEFIENIYYKIYIHYPDFIRRTIYRILYTEFDVLYHVLSDEFIEEFYTIHRIFLPLSKITRLYNKLNLESYREYQQNNENDWEYNLKSLDFIFS